MGPFATTTAVASFSSIAPALMKTGVKSLTEASRRFSDFLDGSQSSSSESIAPTQASQPDSASTLDSIAEQIRQRVLEALGRLGDLGVSTVQLELSALGDVYVSGLGENTAFAETLLDSDRRLTGLLTEWTRLSGNRTINLSLSNDSDHTQLDI